LFIINIIFLINSSCSSDLDVNKRRMNDKILVENNDFPIKESGISESILTTNDQDKLFDNIIENKDFKDIQSILENDEFLNKDPYKKSTIFKELNKLSKDNAYDSFAILYIISTGFDKKLILNGFFELSYIKDSYFTLYNYLLKKLIDTSDNAIKLSIINSCVEHFIAQLKKEFLEKELKRQSSIVKDLKKAINFVNEIEKYNSSKDKKEYHNILGNDYNIINMYSNISKIKEDKKFNEIIEQVFDDITIPEEIIKAIKKKSEDL